MEWKDGKYRAYILLYRLTNRSTILKNRFVSIAKFS